MSIDRPVVVDTKTLPPDPSLVRSLGLHHSITTAIADLVDNSVDAGAENILIRLEQRGIRTVGLAVIDDGKGMDDSAIDSAMTYAKKRDYAVRDLGHFGLGLKAASLSQAETLVVWSKAYGANAVGRMLNREEVGRNHAVAVLSNNQAARRLEDIHAGFEISSGTIVEWRDIYTFLSSDDPDDQASWLEQTINEIRTHLGIVLHRILAAGRVSVTIQQYDLDAAAPGIPRSVQPIDPFLYRPVGGSAYPRVLNIQLPGLAEPVRATAHIWPAAVQEDTYRLFGRPGREYQGFYFYRNDRLLQVGGWNGIVYSKAAYELGRVAIELRDDIDKFVTINPEKSGLVLVAEFDEAIQNARFEDGDGDFPSYLADLEDRHRRSRKRKRLPVSLVEPGFGLPGSVIDVIDETVQISEAADAFEIRWRALPLDKVFEIDLEGRRLNLNARMRDTLVGGRSRDPEDAPVIKVLFLLLTSTLFESSRLGPAERQRVAAWQEILLAAVDEQRHRNEQKTSSKNR